MNGIGYYFTVLGGTSSQQAVLSKKESVQETDGDSDFSIKSSRTYGLLPNVKAESDVDFGSNENSSLKKLDELDKIKSNKTYEGESSDTASSSDQKHDTRPSSDALGNVVLRRDLIKGGPRPTTFPLCLLQPEVVNSSSVALQYIQQQQEVLEEMGHQGYLKGLSLAEDESKDNRTESSDTRQSHGLSNKESSYENIYDGADLIAAKCEDTPSTAQLTSSLGDPFTTKTQLPPEMCSSFENIYFKAQAVDENIVREADYLAAEILEEAVQEAAREGQMWLVTPGAHTSVSSDMEVFLPGEALGHKGHFEINSKKSGSEGIVVV